MVIEDGLHGRGDAVRALGSLHNFEGDVTAVGEIVCQPDGRKTPISKLVDHLIAISPRFELVQRVAQMDGMEAILLILLEIFDMVQVGWRILGFGSHVVGVGCKPERLAIRSLSGLWYWSGEAKCKQKPQESHPRTIST